MVLSQVDESREKRQQHLANLLNLVQQRSQAQKRRKLEEQGAVDLDHVGSIGVSPAALATGAAAAPDTTMYKAPKIPEAPPKPKARASKKASTTAATYDPPQQCLPPFDFKNDTSVAALPFELQKSIHPRPYQLEALASILSGANEQDGGELAMNDLLATHGTAQSGIIVLPCGAGKTLTSILVACAIQKPTLVVCSTVIAALQFQKEFLRSTTLMASRMGMFAGSKKWPYNGPSGVLFTTYTMLMDHHNRTADSKRMAKFIDTTQWGLVIFDEVHCGPAANYSRAMTKIQTKVRLGLTATMLREDDKIGHLDAIVGPTVYRAKWKELADRGYIAKVVCTQVETKLTPQFRRAYEELNDDQGDGAGMGSMLGTRQHLRSLLSILNPSKMQVCQRLIQYHEARGDKVLVYCDHIDALKLYAEQIGRPYIYGGTATADAQKLLERFQIDVSTLYPKDHTPTWAEQREMRVRRTLQINTLFLSRIGDTSLDLPAATVLIQVSSHFGSRRQEAQRLGRVLRAKRRNEKGFYSRFYTLVSNDSHETHFSERRRQFLEEECGYGYQIWQVGDRQEPPPATDTTTTTTATPAFYGWHVNVMPNTTTPLDDEIKLEPLTCHLQSTAEQPYTTPDAENRLVDYIMGLKNVQVEDPDDDDDDMASVASKSSSAKRKRT